MSPEPQHEAHARLAMLEEDGQPTERLLEPLLTDEIEPPPSILTRDPRPRRLDHLASDPPALPYQGAQLLQLVRQDLKVAAYRLGERTGRFADLKRKSGHYYFKMVLPERHGYAALVADGKESINRFSPEDF